MDKTPQNRDEKVAMILKYFGVIMAIFYFIMGTALCVLPLFDGLETAIRYGFAVMLILYGSFRLYRILKS